MVLVWLSLLQVLRVDLLRFIRYRISYFMFYAIPALIQSVLVVAIKDVISIGKDAFMC